MKLRAGVLGASAMGFAFAACQLIGGIGDHDFTVPSSGDASDGRATAGECRRADPIGPPPDGAADPPGLTYVVAMRTADISGSRDGGAVGAVAVGYDLDQVCTCDEGESRGPSCVSTGDAGPKCDADGGVDNGGALFFGGLRPFFGSENLLQGLNQHVQCGEGGALIVLSEYNGLADDGRVKVAVLESYGIEDPHAGEPPPDPGCAAGGAPGPPFKAQWNGTDQWSVKPGAWLRGEEPRAPSAVTGWVHDFQLVVDFRSDPSVAFPFLLRPETLQLRAPVLTAKLVPVDASGADIAVDDHGNLAGVAAAFRLDDAVITGRVPLDDMLSGMGALRWNAQYPYLCAEPVLYPVLKKDLCGSGDIARLPFDEGAAPCDALSLTIQITTKEARIGSDYLLPSTGDAGCGPEWRDTCGTP